MRDIGLIHLTCRSPRGKKREREREQNLYFSNNTPKSQSRKIQVFRLKGQPTALHKKRERENERKTCSRPPRIKKNILEASRKGK